MKSLTLITTIIALSAPVYAETVTEGTIKDFNKTISRQIPITSEVCEWQQKTSTGAGALIGGIFGAIAGEVIGGGDVGTRNAAGAFGALVGGSEAASSGQVKVCKDVTTYRTEYENVYSHSIITFFNNNARYQLRFIK